MQSPSDRQNIHPVWDGYLLGLQAAGSCRIGVCLDGSRFIELQTGVDGRADLALPFSPSGWPILSVTLNSPDESDESARQAFSVEFGKAGIMPTADQRLAVAELNSIGEHLPDTAQPMQPEVAIIIPVYNAIEQVKRCLDSVIASSSGRCRLIVIDDASTQPEIAPMLAGYRGIAGVEIHSNPVNLGFTATVNRGMSLAGLADVVLLNADTEVASQWLTGLRCAVYASEDIATATAVSNNAGAFSVPELELENSLPPEWTFSQTARAHWHAAGHAYPQLPTGNGFCMYIRRNVLDQVGLFDVEAFPQGYGEENDFCQRASAAGWRHVIAGNVLVLHARSMSFGVERREALGRAGMQVLRERWPNYESDVGRQLFSFERRVLDWRVRRIHAMAARHVPLPRLLRYCGDSCSAGASGFDIRVLELSGNRLSVNGETIKDWQTSGTSTGDPRCISRLLQDCAFELLEIDRGMQSGLIELLRNEADRLGIPVLLLEAGEPATFARREMARNSLNRFSVLPR